MHTLMGILTTDGLANQSSQLALGHVPFMEYHTADNDPVDRIHLGQAAVNLLLEDPISYDRLSWINSDCKESGYWGHPKIFRKSKMRMKQMSI